MESRIDKVVSKFPTIPSIHIVIRHKNKIILSKQYGGKKNKKIQKNINPILAHLIFN